MKQNLMPIFAVSSNFPLDVLCNGSGCELFSQSVLYIYREVIRSYKILSRLNLRTNFLNTHICCASKFFLRHALWSWFKASLLAHPVHRTMQDNKGKVKKEVQNTKFRSIVWKTGNCNMNMYPKTLSMFYKRSYLIIAP